MQKGLWYHSRSIETRKKAQKRNVTSDQRHDTARSKYRTAGYQNYRLVILASYSFPGLSSKDGRKEKARNDGKHHPAAPKRALPFAAADRGLLLPPAHASTRTPHALLPSWRGELICS